MSVDSTKKNVELPGKYTVLRPLGKGAMGTVYEASHRTLKRRVAVKILHEQHAGDVSLMRRFAREATAISQLRSRYVVRVFDSDSTPDGAPFIVMELLSGRDLAAQLRAEAPARERVVDWIVQICSAMDEAHRLGIIHRDLKPSNIFIAEPDKTVRVLDFGISRLVEGHDLTAGSEILGTPNYIAPEVLQGRAADARSDLYAIGVIAYRALSGRFPCEPEEVGKNPFSALLATVIVPATPIQTLLPDLPKELADAIMKALAKDPAERFATARELGMAVRPFGTAAAEFEELPESDATMPVRDPSSAPPLPASEENLDATEREPLRVSSGSDQARISTESMDLAAPALDPPPSRARWRRVALGLAVLGALAGGGAIVAAVAWTPASRAATTTSAVASKSSEAATPASPPSASSAMASAAPSLEPSSQPAPAQASSNARPTSPVRPTPPPAVQKKENKDRGKERAPPPKRPGPRVGPSSSGEVLFIE